MLACGSDFFGAVTSLFVSEVFRWQRERARKDGLAKVRYGHGEPFLVCTRLTKTKPVVATAHTTVTQGAAPSSTSAAPTPSNAKTNEPAPSRAVDNQASATTPDLMPTPEFLDTPATSRPSNADAPAIEVPGASGRAFVAPAPNSHYSPASAPEESQLVRSARSMLRAGSAADALQLLELATSRFPQGILIQKREALRIEALAALGRTREARRRKRGGGDWSGSQELLRAD